MSIKVENFVWTERVIFIMKLKENRAKYYWMGWIKNSSVSNEGDQDWKSALNWRILYPKVISSLKLKKKKTNTREYCWMMKKNIWKRKKEYDTYILNGDGPRTGSGVIGCREQACCQELRLYNSQVL